jgi:hypothetical protein
MLVRQLKTTIKLGLCLPIAIGTLALYNFAEQKIQHPTAKQCGVCFVVYSASENLLFPFHIYMPDIPFPCFPLINLKNIHAFY